MLSLPAKIAIPLALLSSFAAAAPSQWHSARDRKGMSVGKAIYFLTNEAENAVVALPIGKNGMLSKGSVTMTGGAGSNSIDGMTMEVAMADPLISQSALTIAGNHIFAVNAGSNTLTMLTINPNDATCLTMVGKPAKIPGEFPNTVAASAKNGLVCVATTGAVAGVSCTNFSSRKGLGQMDKLRPFDIGQSTPPVGPTNTVSHSFFSADEKTLFTTVKGDPPNNKTGFLSAFPVQESRGVCSLSTKETRSSPAGTAVLFGSSTIPNSPNTIFATDASFGAAVLSVDQMGQAAVVNAQPIEGQIATCWVAVSDKTNSAFVTDVAVNRVVEMSLKDAAIISQLDLSANGDPGLIDLRAAGNFVYALSPGNATTQSAISVLDISGGQGSMKQAQHFPLTGIAGRPVQGMAVLL